MIHAPDVAHREPERLGHAPAERGRPCRPGCRETASEARARMPVALTSRRTSPASAGQPRREARADERRDAVERGERRDEVAGVAERPEEAAAEPGADGPTGPRLVQRLRARVVGVERDDREAGEGQGEDALGLAHPAAGLAPGLLLRRFAPASRADRRGRARRPSDATACPPSMVRHQTVSTRGSTTGFRWNRWLMKRRTALRTVAPISSLSIDVRLLARGERLAHRRLDLLHQLVGLLHVDEPARGDLGSRDDGRRRRVDGERRRHHARLGEELPVAQHHRRRRRRRPCRRRARGRRDSPRARARRSSSSRARGRPRRGRSARPGGPRSRARRACCSRWRYSPWTGMKYCGRVSASMCFRSSWLAWPETWTNATSSHRTSAPRRSRALIARPITRSFPGITREEKITRSPGPACDVLVLARRDERDRRVRLALAPRGEDHLARGGQLAELVERDDEPLGHPEVAQLRGDARHWPSMLLPRSATRRP